MATTEFQYHLTFNGKFSNETYIEYFNPNRLGKVYKADDEQSTCTEAIKNLKEAFDGKGISEEECEQTFRKIHEMLCNDQCKSDCNPCGDQIESKNLYFFEEYQKAIDIIIEMVEEWLRASDKTDLCQRMKCQWNNLPKNNRILFHGQRGSGKTSVTMSVAKSLEGFGIGCYTFKVLPIINPGYFDTDTNILKTIISNMFEMAKCIIKKADNDSQRNNHEELLKKFEEVYRLLGCIESPNKEKHTLETLNEISKASGMREAMQDLVNKFIKILPCKAKYLVLVIDDVDMSVAYAATMLEQINKFLELDNLLILISANLGQLHNEMREHYSKAFEKTLRDKNQALSIDVEDLASKYLLKLFPTSRRINVERPVSQLLQTELIISNEMRGGLQKLLLSLIWAKTRLLYIPKDENTLHPIIPTNLRELTQLINLLQGMKKVETGKDKKKQMLFADLESYENCQNNINTFKNYFLNIWVPTHLAVNEEEVFINIPSDITEINKHLINSINVIGTDNKKRLMSREVDLDIIERNAEGVSIDRDIYTMVSPNDPRFVKANKISDIFNQPSNYSYGDLLLMIDKYETYFESEENRRFSNAIKIYYSILLFETMFFKSDNVKYDKSEFDTVKSKGEEVVAIQKLIGGTVYYPNYFEIITSKYFTQKGPSYDAKRAFYHKVPIEHLIGANYPLFSVLYYGDIRPDRYETKHIYDTTYYNNADVDGQKYITFDILSILNNVLNPWHTVNRTDDNKKNSIWRKRIKEWGAFCSIGNSISTPNSILPFYAVDVMLLILKNHSVSDVEIIQNGTKCDYRIFKENKSIIDEVKNILCSRNKIVELNNKKKLKIVIGDAKEKDNTTYCVEALITRQLKQKDDGINDYDESGNYYYKIIVDVQKKDGVSSRIVLDDDSNPIFMVNGKWKVKSDSADTLVTVLQNIQNILIPIMECYWMVMDKCNENLKNGFYERISLPDRFRDHCIALVLSEYKGGKKDRIALIRGLKKHNTISEMYMYLVEELWENAATETLIRQQIQKGIRDNKTVGYYYQGLLLQLIESPFIDSLQRVVYDGAFQEACKWFVMERNK